MKIWFEDVARDLKLALRRARRRPGFTATVVICLGLGIGATTGVMSVLQPVLGDAIPFEHGDRLFQVTQYDRDRTDPEDRFWIGWAAFETVQREAGALEAFAGFGIIDLDVYADGETQRVQGALTIPGSHDVLGVKPLLGRGISTDDLEQGRRTAVISRSFWSRQYGESPDVLGKRLDVQGRMHSIVGVVADDFRFPDRTELWIILDPGDLTDREVHGKGNLQAIGRLAAGAPFSRLKSDLDAVARGMEAEFPEFYTNESLEAVSMQEVMVGQYEGPLLAVMVGAVFVLLIAVANVANLILVRFQAEKWERAVRTAMGASRRAVARQGLVENLLLSTAGGVFGVAMASQGVPVLMSFAPVDDPAFDAVGLSLPVLGLAVGLVMIVGLLLALVPLMDGQDRFGVLREQGRGGSGSRRQRFVQDGFVIGQVAVSLVLLVGAGLLVGSFRALQDVDPGFQTENLASVRVSAPPTSAGTHEGRVAFLSQLRERVGALPGVLASAAVQTLPIIDGEWGYAHSVEDRPPEIAGATELGIGRVITPGFFDAMGIPIVAGRDFTDADRLDAPWVVIVSHGMAEEYWPGEDPIGKRIKRGSYESTDRPWMEVVGVAGDIRGGVDLASSARPALYYSVGQIANDYVSVMTLAIRTAGDPQLVFPGVRRAVADISDRASVFRPLLGSDLLGRALARQEFSGLVFLLFGIAGVVLAATGVYGMASFAVGRRTREFGLRMALGARPPAVLRLVLLRSLRLALGGLAVGVIASLAVSGLLDDMLFGVQARDPRILIFTSALMSTTVLLASYLPARRATLVDPTVALRDD